MHESHRYSESIDDLRMLYEEKKRKISRCSRNSFGVEYTGCSPWPCCRVGRMGSKKETIGKDDHLLEKEILRGLSESSGLALEKVSTQCISSEMRVNLAVWITVLAILKSPSSRLFILLFSCWERHLFNPLMHCWLIFTIRFNGHLGKKGISGNIKVSYEEKTLSVEVKMPQDASSRIVRDTRGLSVSRKISLDSLVEFALAQGSQWIFITPHDIRLNCPDAAMRSLELARQHASSEHERLALNNLGSVYADCWKLDSAADCYINALKIRHTRAHQGLARVHFLRNDKAPAYDEMTKLIETVKNNASAYEKRSEYCDRDRDLTKEDLEMVTQLDPLRVYPYRYRAAVLMDSYKEKEAIVNYLGLLHLKQIFIFYTYGRPSMSMSVMFWVPFVIVELLSL
ncbi:hypothetical protein CRYUN_Cryun01aG0168700 [Craigia yunnanensis]